VSSSSSVYNSLSSSSLAVYVNACKQQPSPPTPNTLLLPTSNALLLPLLPPLDDTKLWFSPNLGTMLVHSVSWWHKNDKNESLLLCQAINACCSMTQANPVWNGWSSELSAYHGKLNVDCYQSKHLLYLCQEVMAANCIILSMLFLSGQWLKCHIAVASGVLHPMWKVPG